ncbi:MAG: response regulator transcription factor [Bdellovibrionota bacterium]
MARILLVEDDPNLGKGLKFTLEKEGYEVQWVDCMSSAENTIMGKVFDLLALDLNLPDGSGLTLAKWARKNHPRLPVFMITASGDEETVVAGFEAGAVDYVRKPFSTRELVARIKVALNLRNSKAFRSLQYGDISIQPDQRIAKVGETPVELNRRQFDILCHLVENAESVVTRESLISALAKNEEMFDRTIDSHVSFLRSRLRKAGLTGIQINSVYGLGYRMEKTH